MSIYDSGPKEGQSAREDLKGLKISVTPMADLFDRRGGQMYEVFAQKIEIVSIEKSPTPPSSYQKMGGI